MEEVDQGHLVEARVLAVAALVGGGDQAGVDRGARVLRPRRGDANLVDAVAPRVPLDQLRLGLAIGPAQLEEAAGGALAHVAQRRLDFAQGIGRHGARQKIAQRAVAVVLVVELRRVLNESHGGPPARFS